MKECVSEQSRWALTSRILHLLWGRWQFKPSDVLKVSCWALSIWQEHCYLSVHALRAPLPNLFSSSQGLGLGPESASSLPLVSNPPPALIPGWCRSLQQASCPCLQSAKTTAGVSHPAMGSLQFCLQVQVSLAPDWVLGWQQYNPKLENSILNPNKELLTLQPL